MKLNSLLSSNKILWIFGQRVQEERKKDGITQEELADHTGVSVDTIKRIESGKSVKLDVAYRIAVALRLPLQSLLPPQKMEKEELAERIKAAQDTLQFLFELHKK